jgi:hypothetical protein
MPASLPRILVVCAILGAPAAPASDHLDATTGATGPAADIGDFYAWMSPDARRLRLVMTLVGEAFSDHVDYVFHLDSGAAVGASTASLDIRCRVAAANAIECRAGDIDASRLRVFAGVRNDPFFNNVRGSRAALEVATAAMRAGAPKDAGGCPRFDAATAERIAAEWRQTDGGPGRDFLAGWTTAAIVIEIDVAAVTRGGPMIGAWATTEAPDTPQHRGHYLDRMGRALTGNALLGTFADPSIAESLKRRYNRATRDRWAAFAPDLAANLAAYDGFDGLCGNQWLAVGNAPAATRYDGLAQLLADDRLWVNSRSGRCTQYLAAEFDFVGAVNDDCGGRAPGYDAVDVFRSLLSGGGIAGLADGVDRDDAPLSPDFPFLAPATSNTGR